MPRGGRRQGRVGDKFSNRTDLQLGARLPVQTAPSQGYGDRAAQERAQQAVPLKRAGGMSPAQRPAAGGAAEGRPPLPALDAPTEFPDEPVTAGSAFGAGPGPSVLGLPGQPDLRAEDVEAVRRYLPALEAMASQPNASPSTRDFVRRLRAAVPVGP